MKKTVIIAAMAIVGLCAFNNNKEKEYRLTQGQVQILFQSMQISAKAIPSSDAISAHEASAALQGIDSIAKVLGKQYSDTTRK